MREHRASRGLSWLLVWLATAAWAGPSSGQTRPFTAEDMLAVVGISGLVAVSPQGDRLAYVLPDVADEWNVGARPQRGALYVQRLTGTEVGPPIRVGLEGQWSSFPAFSPDGDRLAFYVTDADGSRLALWAFDSSRTQIVGARFTGSPSSAPAWTSNNGIVYARTSAEPPPPESPRVQVLESTDRMLPGDAFFRNDRRSGLAVFDVSSGRERTLIADRGGLRRFELAPDGRHALVSATGPDGGNEVAVWPIGRGGEPLRLEGARQRASWMPDGRLFWRDGGRLVARAIDAPSTGDEAIVEALGDIRGDVAWAPDARRFAHLAADPSITDPEIETPQAGMYTIARPFTDLYLGTVGSPGSRNLTAGFPDNVSSPVWSADGTTLFFVATDNATYDETLYRYDVASDTMSVLAEGRESFDPLTTVPGGLLVSRQSATTPSDVWRVDAGTGTWTRVTDLNPQLSTFIFSEPELFHFDNADGDRLGALLYRPAGATADVPVVTYVYEKLTPGIHRFAARQQIFATHGYAVLMPNVKVKVGETGTSFVKAVVPAVAAVEAMGFTNGRFCLWGGSFGAYATSFVITQTTVFDCAVSRATPPELFRNWASGRDRDSDNIERGQARMGDSPFKVMERYLSQSAFFHLDQVETPVLLLHGEKDYTILFEEGAMMFYALRRLGKEATFVAYRDGDHSLYRHSRADALDVHRRMLDWFERYLRQPRRP